MRLDEIITEELFYPRLELMPTVSGENKDVFTVSMCLKCKKMLSIFLHV